MLQYEDITKVQELKGKFKKVWMSSEYLQEHLNILGFNKIKIKFNWCKKAGYSFEQLISTLLVFSVIGIQTINELVTSKKLDKSICGKDSYYRLLANEVKEVESFIRNSSHTLYNDDSSFAPLFYRV